MDKLKNLHDTLFNYKTLYDKQKELIKFFKMNNTLSDELYDKLKETIEDYNRDIKEISVFENIRNEDIIKFNKIKVNHDIKLQKLATEREIELLRISMNSKRKKEEIESGIGTIKCCFN
jgi:phosphoribosylaminoimidazole-succinocarboxamide synthase